MQLTMTKKQIEKATQLLCGAYLAQRQIMPNEILDCTPKTRMDAYAIQDAVAERLWLKGNVRVNTWKVGAGTPDNDSLAYAAPIPPTLIFENDVTLISNQFHMLGVEAELAFRFSQDLPPTGSKYSFEQVMSAIEAVYVTIELVDTRVGEWEKSDSLWQLADNQISGGLVVGSRLADFDNIDFSNQQVELLINEQCDIKRQGSHPLVDPRPLLHWLANHCTQRSGGLRAGDLVTTGTWVGMTFVEPGTKVTAKFRGIGEASVSFSK